MWFSRTTVGAGSFGRLSTAALAIANAVYFVQCVSLSFEGARTGKSRSQASIVLEGFVELYQKNHIWSF